MRWKKKRTVIEKAILISAHSITLNNEGKSCKARETQPNMDELELILGLVEFWQITS